MLKTVQGVILRTVKYSETSIIFDAYTLELGLRTYIINGVRKKNAKVSPALIQPMSLVEMVVYHNEEKEINRLKEIKPSYVYQQVHFEVTKGTVGLFITEVIQKSVKEITPNETLFDFLEKTYQQLDQTATSIANFPGWFLVQFAQQLGLLPTLEPAEELYFDYAEGVLVSKPPVYPHFLSPFHTKLLTSWQPLSFEQAAKLIVDTTDRRLFLNKMIAYYQYNIDGFGKVNSLLILQEIFS
jgi:DNA repair protein RecO (recombination protein O)